MELVYELRIGNLVSKSLKSGNGRTFIDKVGPQDIVRIYENISHFNYHPIKLTEKWLFKFGFEQNGILELKFDEYSKGFITLGMVNGGEEIYQFIYDGKCFLTFVEYVHQLQNLYFALTGKELTYHDVI